jgi:hypothetical protein
MLLVEAAAVAGAARRDNLVRGKAGGSYPANPEASPKRMLWAVVTRAKVSVDESLLKGRANPVRKEKVDIQSNY